MDCATIKSQRKVRLQNSSKANAGNVMFVGKQSKVAGKFTKTLDVHKCDVEFIYDIGADVSIVIETTTDMLGLKLQKPDWPLTSADGYSNNVAGVCNAQNSEHSYLINADVYVFQGSKKIF